MGTAIRDPSEEDLHRRGQRCVTAVSRQVRCDPHIGRHGTSALCDASGIRAADYCERARACQLACDCDKGTAIKKNY